MLVDLSECTFADSSLVKVLSDTRERFDDRGVILEAVIPHEARAVRRLAEMTRLAEIVPIYESRNAAIQQRAQRA